MCIYISLSVTELYYNLMKRNNFIGKKQVSTLMMQIEVSITECNNKSATCLNTNSSVQRSIIEVRPPAVSPLWRMNCIFAL